MKILCIGNSFSQDACAYLHSLAGACGKNVDTLNLYIGGCPLEEHAYNIFFNKPYYDFEYNGNTANCRKGSIQEALTEEKWDYISLQQASHFSGQYETYQPHLRRIVSRIRDVCPEAKIIIHQTWAYEDDSTHSGFKAYGNDRFVMHRMLSEAYSRAAEDIKADLIVDTGNVVHTLRQYKEFNIAEGGTPLTRDGFHLSLIYGRYAAAATWLDRLGLLCENDFIPEGADPKLIKLIYDTVSK